MIKVISNIKGTCSKLINNVKRFFTDDAGDYTPIGCVAATLNNSVLHKTHISCDETMHFFFCKQSEYFIWVCSLCFCRLWTLYRLWYFNYIVKNLQYNNFLQNKTKILIKQTNRYIMMHIKPIFTLITFIVICSIIKPYNSFFCDKSSYFAAGFHIERFI